MRIYTRGGDTGDTSLFDGSRVSKADLRVEAYGTVDELNAWLSLVRATSQWEEIRIFVERLQNELFTIGGDLATPTGAARKVPRATQAMVDGLEKDIDGFMHPVGTLGGFVLPGESETGARLHLARTVARRAERAAVLAATQDAVNPLAIVYLNRLSDALFGAAAWVDRVAQGRELRNPTY